MSIYIFGLISCGVLSYFIACSPMYFIRDDLQQRVINSKLQKRIIFFCTVSLIILIGLRGEQVGSDTKGYMKDYLIWGSRSLSELKISLNDEVGYKFLQRILTLLGINWQIFLFITAIIIVGSYSVLVKKYSCYAYAPYFLYVTIGLFAMNMTGIRQSLAVAFCLIAYMFAEKRKILWFIVSVTIAVTIHASALCFFPVYFIFLIKKTSKKVLLIFLFLPLLTRAFSSLLARVLYMFAFNRYIGNGYFSSVNLDLNILAELFPFAILVLGFILLIVKAEITSRDCNLFIMTSIYASTYQLTHAVYMAGRLCFYFSPFMVLFLGNAVFSIKDARVRVIAYVGMLLVAFLFFEVTIPGSSYRIDNYSFFWN